MNNEGKQRTIKTISRFSSGVLILVFSTVFFFESTLALGYHIATAFSEQIMFIGSVMWSVLSIILAVSVTSRNPRKKGDTTLLAVTLFCLFCTIISLLGASNADIKIYAEWANACVSAWWLWWVSSIELYRQEKNDKEP